MLCAFLLSACHDKNKSEQVKKTHIIVAKEETPVKKLYYTGALNPIQTLGVVTPVAGNIVSIDFNYGERVKKGQVLLIIHSRPLAENYQKAITDFIHKKQAYSTAQDDFAGTQALYNAGAIAKNDYDSAKTQFENSALDYLQSRYELEKVLHTASVDSKKIEALSISDTETVNAILQKRFQHIEVLAPDAGVALFPTETTDSSGNKTDGKLTQGMEIKEGQLLLQIGDLTGLSATFDVSEVDIDSIKKGMSVLVTGDAFPNHVLTGYVEAVSAQAKQNSGESGLSMFVVKIKIPNVDQEIMKKIRVGMTAKFEIDIKSAPRIILPIKAIAESNGITTATILDAQGKEKKVSVVTGDTTPAEVVVVSGIKVGDRVVIND